MMLEGVGVNLQLQGLRSQVSKLTALLMLVIDELPAEAKARVEKNFEHKVNTIHE